MNLSVGKVLSVDVFNSDGVLLAADGTTLTQELVTSLFRDGVSENDLAACCKRSYRVLRRTKSWKCNKDDLWGATEGCTGNIIPAGGGGVKCSKCSGWFCF